MISRNLINIYRLKYEHNKFLGVEVSSTCNGNPNNETKCGNMMRAVGFGEKKSQRVSVPGCFP